MHPVSRPTALHNHIGGWPQGSPDFQTLTMTRISDAWPNPHQSLQDLEPDHVHRITLAVSFLQSHLQGIRAFASSLHPQQRLCNIDTDRFTWGQSFTVFEVVFDDGLSWILRLGMCSDDEYYNTTAQLERKILNEAAALHLVRERTTIPVPAIIAYSPVTSPSSPLGPDAPPFVMMTALQGTTIEDLGIAISEEGDPLQGDDTKRPILERYLSDIADLHVQLSRITFDQIGSFVLNSDDSVTIGPGAEYGVGPFTSAQKYFEVQAEAYEMLAQVEGSDDGTDDDRQRRQFVASLWKDAVMSHLDKRDDAGPFPMRHGDLHSQNILVDSSGHIVGVLDWDCAGTVPWEAFAVPTFEVSGDFVDLGYGNKEDRLVVHEAFNRRLRQIDNSPKSPSGRTLADLHDSKAGHIAGYLAYWMLCTACDYDYTGRALHDIMGSEQDIETDFRNFAVARGYEPDLAHSDERCGTPSTLVSVN
jgi:hypothetical protein